MIDYSFTVEPEFRDRLRVHVATATEALARVKLALIHLDLAADLTNAARHDAAAEHGRKALHEIRELPAEQWREIRELFRLA